MPNFKTNRILLYVSAFFVVVLVLFAIFRDNSTSITLKQAHNILNSGKVKGVIVTKEYVYLKSNDALYKIASSQVTPKMFMNYKVEVGDKSYIVLYLFIFVLLVGIISLAFKAIQNKHSFIEQKPMKNTSSYNTSDDIVQAIKSDVSFDDIGGISDVKVELEEIIDFMKNPKRYKSFGARMPRGVLLVGPPGVGKTMIAKAVANAADVPFFYQSGASFVQIYVGMGAKRVHDLFVAAKKNAPSIIFIDEIDAVGKKRDGQRNDEREATLNQLLTEMDGFENSSGIIVVAATNKIDVLDSALLRAGRFDRRIFVELPTKIERASILQKYIEKIPHDLDAHKVANMTVGFNGASLAALVNEAALLSLRQNDLKVTMDHFHQVKDKVLFGKKKLKILTEKQKEYRITYQAAKVICATYYDLPFEKLMLSNERLTPAVEEPLIKHELEARAKTLLAGVVACDIKYGEHTSSAQSDLDDLKELCQKMVQDYGMGQKLTATTNESEELIENLSLQTKELLLSLAPVMVKVEDMLRETESISKSIVKVYLDEVL